MRKRFGFIIQKAYKLILNRIFDWNIQPIKDTNLGVNETTDDESGLESFVSTFVDSTVHATYGSRFTHILFKDFASIYLNKPLAQLSEIDMTKLSELHKTKLSTKDDIAFRDYFLSNVKTFKQNYFEIKNREPNNISIAKIEEEVFHHKHLKNTSSWTLSNSLILCYRFSSAYYGYHFSEKRIFNSRDEQFDVIKLLINSFFIGADLNRHNFPLLEGYKHLNDNLDYVKKNYGIHTFNICIKLIELKKLLNKGQKIEILENELFDIAQIIIDFPFASYFLNEKEITFFKFENFYKLQPKKRLDFIIEKVKEKNNISSIIHEIPLANKTEKGLISNLTFYASQSFIPPQLVWFVMKGVAFSGNYFSVFFKYVKDTFFGKGKGLENNSYIDYPAIVARGTNGSEFSVDFAMNYFDASHFKKALVSFEPALLKEGLNKGLGSKFMLLPIQCAFLRTLFAVCICRQDEKSYFAKNWEFSFQWDETLIAYKERIISFFLNQLFKIANEEFYDTFQELYLNKRENPINETFIYKFQENFIKILHLFYKIEDKNLQEKIYLLCDLNYAKGM